VDTHKIDTWPLPDFGFPLPDPESDSAPTIFLQLSAFRKTFNFLEPFSACLMTPLSLGISLELFR
jgi:hypothetical protein